jgi:exosortase D (VPLPA-CTERM-specific)
LTQLTSADSGPVSGLARLRFSPAAGLLVLGTLAIAIVPFLDALSELYDIWNLRPEYSHGTLIPLLSLFLIWRKRDWLSRTPFQGSWWGVAIIAFGMFMWFAGALSTTYVIVHYGFLVVLYGMVIALTGWRVFRELLAPLALLIFMVPLPAFLIQGLSLQLQLLSSTIGVSLIRLAGISVFVEGNVIDLGNYQLQVAEACDGLRYLFPLMTLGFLFGYFFRGPLWKKLVLFFATIPLAIAMNVIRIAVIGVTVEHWGIRMAEGFLHEFQGWAVFMVSTAILILLAGLLTRIGRPRIPLRDAIAIDWGPPINRSGPTSVRALPPSFTAAAVLGVCATLVAFAMPDRKEIVPTRAAFVEFPRQVGQWSGRQETLEKMYVDALKLDDYLLANYHSTSGSLPVNVYAAYYGSQRSGQSAHSPRSCLPGGGWTIRSLEKRAVAIPGREQPLMVNRVKIELGSQRQIVYYWFQQRGRVITNEYLVKWYIFLDAMSRNRTDGALVRLTGFLPDGASEAQTDAAVAALAAEVVPLLDRYVPN